MRKLGMTFKQTLFTILTGVVLGSGLLISQAVAHRYSARLMEGAIARAENIARKLSLDATDKILTNDLVALHKLLRDQAAADAAVGYLFIVRDGRVLAHTFDEHVPAALPAANAPESEKTGRVEKIVSQRGERFIDVAWPIFDGVAGVLRLGYAEAPMQRETRQLWGQMSLLTLGVLALTLTAAHLMVRRLTRPLESLAAAAQRIGAGDLAASLKVEGGAEVNTLAVALNQMLLRVKEAMHRLEASNRELAGKHQELDRAHRQLSATLDTAREIAALPDLHALGRYLCARLGEIVQCDRIGLLFLSHISEEQWLYDAAKALRPLGAEQRRLLLELIDDAPCSVFKPPIAPVSEDPFGWGADIDQLAVFQLRHHDRLVGGLLIGCQGSCRCLPTELDVIRTVLDQAAPTIMRALVHEDQVRALNTCLGSAAEYTGLVGRSQPMRGVYRLIEDVAPTDATVLISGESGTGKELVARAIHSRSQRFTKPLVVINCSAYPSTLLESELFGHEKGAFTGAVRRKPGRFEQADGGTVFLDEVGEIPATAQIKLLRVLQSQKFERLGGEETLTVDVRVLAASNRDLMEEVKAGRFREDLFYRLNVVPIRLPELRQRRNDIPLLANHFLKRYADEQKKAIAGFSTDAMRVLLSYDWPGNVRELENTIEHACVLCKGGMIETSDLSPAVHKSIQHPRSLDRRQTIMDHEEKIVRQALLDCDWNKTAAAQRLGISRSTLYEKMKRFKINRPLPH